jgi:hypothetical protein
MSEQGPGAGAGRGAGKVGGVGARRDAALPGGRMALQRREKQLERRILSLCRRPARSEAKPQNAQSSGVRECRDSAMAIQPLSTVEAAGISFLDLGFTVCFTARVSCH